MASILNYTLGLSDRGESTQGIFEPYWDYYVEGEDELESLTTVIRLLWERGRVPVVAVFTKKGV